MAEKKDTHNGRRITIDEIVTAERKKSETRRKQAEKDINILQAWLEVKGEAISAITNTAALAAPPTIVFLLLTFQ